MKAIKLASVFAVSAVAAAISTTTFAAEPTFKGTAGLEYKSQESKSKSDAADSRGEVNIIGTVGSVYFDMDMGDVNKDNSAEGFVLDEIYVTQGAVKFGDFDGSLADAAAFSAGVEQDEDGEGKETLGDKLGVRYAVNDNLTVAVEAVEGSDKGTLAAAYTTELSGITLGLSGAYRLSKSADKAAADQDDNDMIVTAGLSAPLGMATFTAFVQTGSKADADVMNTGVGVDLSVSEQLSLAVQYYNLGGESSKGTDHKDRGVTEATAYYAVGDIKYYVSYLAYEADDSNESVVGAKVSF